MDSSPAILDEKTGTLTLPNGQQSTNGATTPTLQKSSSQQQSSIPLPHRSTGTNGASSHTGTFGVKSGLAQMLKGGVIMDVMNVEQAKVAEAAGAVAVMALERIPSLIRSQGGIARMVSL